MKTVHCKVCGGKTASWFKELFDDRHGYPGLFDTVKCEECGFAQTIPQMKKNQLSALYGKYYPRQKVNLESIAQQGNSMPDQKTIALKGLATNCQYWVKGGSKVLDVGCGLGVSLLELERMGCQAYGIDPDPNATKVAKKFKLRFHQGYIEDKPFKGEKFDYVLGSQVLEHTNDPEAFLRECAARLSKNGRVILSFPNTDSLSLRILGKNWLHWHIPFHLNHFSKTSVRLLAKKSGMKIESLKTITPNIWTNLQLRRLMIKPHPGERDTFWDGGSNNQGVSSRGLTWLQRTWGWLENYNYLNRVIDYVGLGDSFVVTFVNK